MRVSRKAATTNPAGSPKITDTTPRKTPFENFEGLAANLLKVPKEELDEKRAEREEARRHEQD